jgi:amidase
MTAAQQSHQGQRPSDLGAVELARAIRAGRLSCVAVMEDFLSRIAQHNGWSNAIVAMRPEAQLLNEAHQRDRDLAAGNLHGWMHGFPQAIKDLAPAAGLAFTQGSPIFAGRVATEDAPFVARMRAAGAIFIGKTNTPEFGLGSQTHNPVFGATRNAYDPARTSGGSSGGAGVALALRMLPVADGSDHAGSLRNPAAWNNVFGMRPGFGRVVDTTADVFTVRLTVAGPMARSVEDLAHLLAVQAGADPRAPLSLDEDPSALCQPFQTSLNGLRIGWLGDFGGHVATEPGIVDLGLAAMTTFAELGAEIVPIGSGFDMERLFQAWKTLRHIQAGSALLPLWQDAALRDALKPEARWEVEQGLEVSGYDIAAAQAVRSDWYQAVLKLFEKVDFLALPATQVFPFDVNTHWPAAIAGRRMDTYHRWMEIVVPATMSGCPVISLPAGFSAEGLPLGVQLWAPWRAERKLLEVAHRYDMATRWPMRRPPPALGG